MAPTPTPTPTKLHPMNLQQTSTPTPSCILACEVFASQNLTVLIKFKPPDNLDFHMKTQSHECFPHILSSVN